MSEIEDVARRIAEMGIKPDHVVLRRTLVVHGAWRVYFSRAGAAGLPWCVAREAGGWEVSVGGVQIYGVATSVYQPKETPDDEDGRPSAWIAVEGCLTVRTDGSATIT